MNTLSYYLYDEWYHTKHLQLVKKTKSLEEIKLAINNWRKDTGTVLHLVEANSCYSARAIIRMVILGWTRDRLPNAYLGNYIEKIGY